MKLSLNRDWMYFSIGLFLGLWFISLGAVDYELKFYPGDLADARFNNYLLEHAWLYFSGKDASFWSAGFMYPEPSVISYSDNLLGAAPFYALFRLVGADRETSFQVWYVLMCALNYTAAFLFLRFLTKHTMAAVCGAMIFAFSIALQSQIVHAQTYARFMMPLAFWAALLYHRDLKPHYFFLTLLAWVYQMYCGIYLGFLLLAPLLMLLGVGVVKRFGLYRLKFRDRRWWLMMGGSGIVNVLLLLPLMLPYLERARQTGFYPYSQVIQSLPTPLSFFFSHNSSLFWEFLKETCISYTYFWDFEIFPGGLAMLSMLVVAGICLWQLIKKGSAKILVLDQNFQLMLWTALLCFLVFLRFGSFSLYGIFYHLPGYGSMRALQRIINVELLFFAVATALVLAQVFKKLGKNDWLVFVLVLVFSVADNRVRPESIGRSSKQEAQDRASALIKKISLQDPQTILSYEPVSLAPSENFIQLDAMMAAQSLCIPTLNGYSATSPKGFDAYWREPNEASRKHWLEHTGLSSEHVQVVK